MSNAACLLVTNIILMAQKKADSPLGLAITSITVEVILL